MVAANQLEQKFDVEAPNYAWVTDITYIRTHEVLAPSHRLVNALADR